MRKKKKQYDKSMNRNHMSIHLQRNENKTHEEPITQSMKLEQS